MAASATVVHMEALTTTLAARVASNLRAEMARQYLGISDLGYFLGYSRNTASAIYHGRRALDMGELEAIAKWLDTTPGALVSPTELGAEIAS